MPSLDESALREIRSLILELKDQILLKLVGKDAISTDEVYRIRSVIDQYRGDDLAAQMEEILSEYAAKSFKSGIDNIDRMVAGEKLTDVLKLPSSNMEIAANYDPSIIKTIAPDLLGQVKQQITLSFLGQRTPGEIAKRISQRFDVSLSRAETIVRTENKKLQNFGAEARIQETVQKAKTLNIPMEKVWIHSSGDFIGYRKGKKRAQYTPRPHHKAMHGVAIDPETKFQLLTPTGFVFEIDGPHDPIMPASEVVNCYCDRSIRINRSKLADVKTPETKPEEKVKLEGFPEKVDELKEVRSLGGTTGAKLVEDPATGKQYVMKRGASADHLREEVYADSVYRALGVDVPNFKLYDTKSGPVKLAEYIPDTTPLNAIKSKKQFEAVRQQLQKDFVADALLGNWDAVGLELDNILVDKAGKAFRIDNGGSLRFRAQGSRKAAFTGEVTELASMLDPKTNAASSRVFGGLTQADIEKQIEALLPKRQIVLEALPAELREVMKKRFDYLESQLSPINERFVEAVKKSRIVGKALKIDREDVEDVQALYWLEKDTKGNPVTRFKMKLTPNGSDRVVEQIRSSVPVNSGWSDPYWDTVLTAAKTVNHHATDGQYNMAKIKAMQELKKVLAELPENSPNQKAMKAHYLREIERIEGGIQNRAALQEHVTKFEPVPEKPTGDIQVRRTTLQYKAKETEKGFAKQANKKLWEEDCYEIEMDGVKYRFVPYRDMNGLDFDAKYAFRGYLEAEFAGDANADAVRKMTRSLESIGIKPKPATEQYLELVYLRKGMQIRTDVFKAADLKKVDAMLVNSEIDDAKKVVEMKKLVKKKLGIELPDMPTDSYNWKPAGNSFGEGWERTYRWDLPRSLVEQEMKDYVLHHTTHQNIPDVIESILAGGGEFTATTERLRKGISISEGMSPTADLGTGGANYLFTRIYKKRSTSGMSGFEFKIGNLARQDVFSFDRDRYGRVSDASAYKERVKTLDQLKACANKSGNESIFKWGINVLDEIESVKVRNSHEREQVLGIFRKHGYTHLPDGRSIEDVVRVG